jgi:hypothetical protein
VRRVALASLALLVAPPAAAVAHVEAAPHLAVTMSSTAVVVRGSSFRSLERVRVSVTMATMRTKRVLASSAGRFSVVFDGLQGDRCSGGVVRATGSRGSIVVAKIPPRECITQRSP